MAELPEIREIIRWTVEPGDRLIAIVNRDAVDGEQAAEVRARLRAVLQLPEDFPIAVTGREWSFIVGRDQPAPPA